MPISGFDGNGFIQIDWYGGTWTHSNDYFSDSHYSCTQGTLSYSGTGCGGYINRLDPLWSGFVASKTYTLHIGECFLSIQRSGQRLLSC